MQLAREHDTNLSELSIMLSRSRAYLQQYVGRGTPKRLSGRDRQLLSDHFGVDEQVLGGPNTGARGPTSIMVPRLGVQASAGAGAEVDGEFEVGSYRFDAAWLRDICSARPENLSVIRVTGDSMAPTLSDSDDVLVDRSAAVRDGVYVLRRDDTLMVKRIALAPSSGTLTISSDNPAYPTWRDVPADGIEVIGRVVWSSRRVA